MHHDRALGTLIFIVVIAILIVLIISAVIMSRNSESRPGVGFKFAPFYEYPGYGQKLLTAILSERLIGEPNVKLLNNLLNDVISDEKLYYIVYLIMSDIKDIKFDSRIIRKFDEGFDHLRKSAETIKRYIRDYRDEHRQPTKVEEKAWEILNDELSIY